MGEPATAVRRARAERLDLRPARRRVEPPDAIRGERAVGRGDDRHHVAVELRHRRDDVVELAPIVGRPLR